jgi:ribosomal-protein-alanine N-acetyltransferase
MNNAHVRPGSAADLDAVLALEQATERAPHWPRAAYEAALNPHLAPRCLFVAERDGAVIGFAVGAMQPGGRVGEIESVAVAQHTRRAGIARDLCAAVVSWCRAHGAAEIVLEVRAGSAGAIALYAGMGFAPAGFRPRYYADPQEDALLMRMALH